MSTALELALETAMRNQQIHQHFEARMIGRSRAPSALLVGVAESLQHLRQQGLLQRDSDVAAVADWLGGKADHLRDEEIATA